MKVKFETLSLNYDVIVMSSDTFLYHFSKDLFFIFQLPFSLTLYLFRFLRYYALIEGHFCLKMVLSLYKS